MHAFNLQNFLSSNSEAAFTGRGCTVRICRGMVPVMLADTLDRAALACLHCRLSTAWNFVLCAELVVSAVCLVLRAFLYKYNIALVFSSKAIAVCSRLLD